MDFEANLVQHCPPAIVRQARAEDVASAGSGFAVLDVAWSMGGRGPGPCFDSVLAYYLPRVGRDMDPEHAFRWLAHASQYRGRPTPGIRAEMEAAARRLPYDPDYAEPYFAYLRAQRIDIREILGRRVTPDWSFARVNTPEAHTWHYVCYLAIMGTDGAWDRLAEKVAATRDANLVMDLLNSLSGLRAPEARAILELYRDDPREIVTAAGRREPLRASVAAMIDFGQWGE